MGRHNEGVPVSELFAKQPEGDLDEAWLVRERPSESIPVSALFSRQPGDGSAVPSDLELALRTLPYRVPPEVERWAAQAVEDRLIGRDSVDWFRIMILAKMGAELRRRIPSSKKVPVAPSHRAPSWESQSCSRRR